MSPLPWLTDDSLWNSHFENDVKYDINVQPPEFVFCAETESELAHGLSPPMPKTTAIESTIATNDDARLLTKKTHAPVQQRKKETVLMSRKSVPYAKYGVMIIEVTWKPHIISGAEFINVSYVRSSISFSLH